MNSRDWLFISALAMGIGLLYLSPYARVPKDVIDDPAHNTYTIHRDPGGNVKEYFDRAVDFDKRGTRVIIDGECDSACNMYTADRGVCVTDNAVLAFHAVRDNIGTVDHPKYGPINQRATDQMLNQLYPPKIRDWVISQGGLTAELKYLSAPEVFKYLPKCS